MLDIKQLTDYLNNILLDTPIAKSSAKNDYCPNGLQVEGKSEIKNIVTGVSASLELINAAIKLNADAIIVHHGFFWKSESLCITNIKKNRIKALLDNNISLYAYHLPLDINPDIGNNRMLGEHLEIFNNITELNNLNNSNILDGLIYQGDIKGDIKHKSGMLFDDFENHLFKYLDHKPLAIKANDDPIKKVAWCTGAGQNFITEAYEAGITTFLSGEISEQTVHQAKEMGVNYFACGHHATERYGVKALSDKLNGDNLNINVKFIDLYIPV